MILKIELKTTRKAIGRFEFENERRLLVWDRRCSENQNETLLRKQEVAVSVNGDSCICLGYFRVISLFRECLVWAEGNGDHVRVTSSFSSAIDQHDAGR